MAKAKGKTKSKKSTKPKAKAAKTTMAKTKPKAQAQAKTTAKAKAKPAPKKPKAKAKAKPAPKKPMAKAKAKPAPKAKKPSTSNGVPAAIAYAELARNGNLDALFGLMDMESSSNNDRLAYKWLNVASDFGHAEADDLIGDVLEVSSMRYDDDAYETAAAHWELAAAYLEGGEGLPVDLGLARKHLAEAFQTHDLAAINAGTQEHYDAEPLLDRLTGDARSLLEAALSGNQTPHDAGDEHDGPETAEAEAEAEAPAAIGGAGVAPVAEDEEEDYVHGSRDDDDEDEDDGA